MTEENIKPEETQSQVEAESAQLTLNDLAAMKSIIDVASSRGAFKPAEMMIVGQTYNKLMAFLDGAKQPQGETK